MWFLFKLAVVVLLVFNFLAYIAFKKNEKEVSKANTVLAIIPDPTPALIESLGYNKPSLSIDLESKRFVLVTPNLPPKVYDVHQLIAVEIERDGQSVIKSNCGSQAAGAAVGAVLLGPAGLSLGGLTGSKRQEENVKRLTLKLYTNDLMSPVVEVPFLSEWVGHNVYSFVVKQAAKHADEWPGRFRTILHMQAA